MTKELLDLLRFRRLDSRNGFASGDDNTVQLMAAAADEIERLKTANAQMLEHGREMWADVERLRAALRDVYEAWAGSDGFIPQTAAEAYQERIIHQMRDAAQRGLGAPVEPTERRQLAIAILDNWLSANTGKNSDWYLADVLCPHSVTCQEWSMAHSRHLETCTKCGRSVQRTAEPSAAPADLWTCDECAGPPRPYDQVQCVMGNCKPVRTT